MPVVDVNGVRLNYLQLAPQHNHASENLVMVHGLATNMAFWYLHYAPVFTRRYRLTLFDLKGHGRSEMPVQGYTPSHLATDLQFLLDELGIERAHFVAHSFGGVVAMNLACSDPARVTSLVLADTHISAARRTLSPEQWGHGDAIQPILDGYGLALDTRDPFFGYKLLTEVARLQLRNEEIPPALFHLLGPLLGKHGNRTAAQWLKLMDSTQAERELMGDDGLDLEKLSNFNFPLLAMYGDRSQAKLTGEQLLDVWPNAAFRLIRDAGHFFPTSKPEEVIALCHRFWDGEFAQESALRFGETKKHFFRTDRVYQSEGAWYVATRESDPRGPFAGPAEAQEDLAALIAKAATRVSE